MGEFDDDKPNGHGKKDFKISGNIYEGNWIDGKGIGQGILIHKICTKVSKGWFWDCELHGFGCTKSGSHKYIGDFKEGDFDGFGKLEDLE